MEITLKPFDEKARELEMLQKITEKFLEQVKRGQFFEARGTALTLHYVADGLWREN